MGFVVVVAVVVAVAVFVAVAVAVVVCVGVQRESLMRHLPVIASEARQSMDRFVPRDDSQ